MSTVKIDEDAQRLLTAEELAALNEDDYDADEENAAALAAAAGEGGQGGQGGEGDGAGAGAGAGAGEGEGEGDGSPAPAAADAAPVQHVQEVAPVYSAELPADHADKVNANKQARKDLRTKFNNGDLDSDEYEAEQERLDEERLELASLQQRAAIAKEMTEQANQNAWVGTINSFMTDAAKAGQVDYRKDQDKQNDLDTFVKSLAAAKGNENKPMRWYLEEAHKRVLALHGLTPAPAKKDPADVARRPNVESIPSNLSGVAGAGGADPMDDEFAALDKLVGMDAERALAAMSPEKQRLYAQRA